MSFPRRKPARIALDWIEEFLLKDKFVEEHRESNRHFYSKTEAGELLHRLLKNGKIMHALLRVSGKRLRRD